VARKIHFHLDEHISHAIAKGLRQRGVDVTTTVEAGLRTLNDEAQMDYIRREQRVLVTNDAGFLARSAEGQPHFGIVYYPSNTRSIGQVVTFLMLMYEILTPEEMVNRVEYL
jgi:predicted nuclease of predicted toxin-antitoxin system